MTDSKLIDSSSSLKAAEDMTALPCSSQSIQVRGMRQGEVVEGGRNAQGTHVLPQKIVVCSSQACQPRAAPPGPASARDLSDLLFPPRWSLPTGGALDENPSVWRARSARVDSGGDSHRAGQRFLRRRSIVQHDVRGRL